MPRLDYSPNYCFIGIDPGKQGGIAAIHFGKSGTDVECWTLNIVDLHLFELLNNFSKARFGVPCHVCLEQVQSMPGEGHKGAFTFGEGFGKLKMALTAAGLGYELVHPKQWQKELGIPGRVKGEPKHLLKQRSLEKAQQLFNHLEIWTTPRSLGVQRAVCDALLLAEYAKRCTLGTLRRGEK